MEYYYDYILVPRWTPIWMNAHIVNANEVKWTNDITLEK
jgi:hypothetical protein